jgi:hypothetical protein
MIEKWNQFAYDLDEAKKRNANENEYHHLIESQLKVLGWFKMNGEVCHKPNIPIGNNNFIQPDILVKKDNEELFVIEVKRPVHVLTMREVQQLESYMRQRKIRIGIYIGEHIEVFYDQPDNADIVSVMKLPLELNTVGGEKFVTLFSKENFSKEALFAFCEEQIAESKRKERLEKLKEQLIANVNDIVSEKLMQYLKEESKGTITEDEASDIISSLTISIVPKQNEIQSESTSAAPIASSILGESIDKPSGKPMKYSINGSPFLAANRFVLEVVRTYVKQHPELTFAELEKVFRPELQGSSGVIRTLEYLRIKNYKGQRFFTDASSVLRSADGKEFAVCTQWSYHNAPGFAAYAKALGLMVETKML